MTIRGRPMTEALREICGECGKTWGAHHCGNPEWCPATEGRMDYMKTTVFVASGEFAPPKPEESNG